MVRGLESFGSPAQIKFAAFEQPSLVTNPGQTVGDNQARNTSGDLQSLEKIYAKKEEKALLPTDIGTKLKVQTSIASSLPEYAVRGLKGDPNADFYERLSIAKIPYYIGGPMLIWCFHAGKLSLPKVKQMAAGVGLYYLARTFADKSVDIPVKMLRGVDTNQYYRDVIDLSTPPPKGLPPYKTQYRKSLISCDWPRTDLYYNKGKDTLLYPNAKNRIYDDIARNMGAQGDLTESDQAVKPNLKKLTVMSRSWKYALAVPTIILSACMASNNCWNELGKGFKKSFRDNVIYAPSDQGFAKRGLEALRIIFKEHLWTNLKTSFIEAWNPELAVKNNKKIPKNIIAKYSGKVGIIGTAAMILLANINILRLTSLKNYKSQNVHNNLSNNQTTLNLFKDFQNKTKNQGGKVNG